MVWSLISYTILNELKATYPTSSNPPSFCNKMHAHGTSRGLYCYFSPCAVEGDEAVQDLVFLDKRIKSKLSASLVASGPAGMHISEAYTVPVKFGYFAGHIHFWNIYNASRPMAYFRAVRLLCIKSVLRNNNMSIQSNFGCVTSVAVDSNNLLLLTGDIEGRTESKN